MQIPATFLFLLPFALLPIFIMESRHALVIGASGLAGWGVVNALLSNYPSQNTFQSVTACVNRPIAVEATQWPVDKAPSLHLIHGVDLTKGSSKDLESMLKTKMGDSLERVTQVYYYGKHANSKLK